MLMTDKKAPPMVETLRHPIVSSAHLAAGGSPALSETEFGLILAIQAFERWIVRCMAASGMPNLAPLEVLILHIVRHRDRPKSYADISLILDIEEPHIVTYALKKLQAAGLVAMHRDKKERMVKATERGVEMCSRYTTIRESLLVKPLRSSGPSEDVLSNVGEVLRALSGYYNQAARSAATI